MPHFSFPCCIGRDAAVPLSPPDDTAIPPSAPLALHGSPQAVNEVVAPQRGQAIWKTTTYKRGDGVQREFDDVPLAHAKKNGWRVMDAWRLTQAALELQSSPWVDDGEWEVPARCLVALCVAWHVLCPVWWRQQLACLTTCFCRPAPFPCEVHYMGYIYAELNQYLLNMIC